jgi:hypothetical protein
MHDAANALKRAYCAKRAAWAVSLMAASMMVAKPLAVDTIPTSCADSIVD